MDKIMEAISGWINKQDPIIVVPLICCVIILVLHFKDMKQIRKMAESSIEEIRAAYADSSKKLMEAIEKTIKKSIYCKEVNSGLLIGRRYLYMETGIITMTVLAFSCLAIYLLINIIEKKKLRSFTDKEKRRIQIINDVQSNVERVFGLRIDNTLAYYPILSNYIYNNIRLLNCCYTGDKNILLSYKPMILIKNTKYVKEFFGELRRIKSVHGLGKRQSDEIILLIQSTNNLIRKIYELEHPVMFRISCMEAKIKVVFINLFASTRLVYNANLEKHSEDYRLLQGGYETDKNILLAA